MAQPIYLEDLGPPEAVKHLETFLKYYVKGQNRAIETVCKYYGYSLTLATLEEQTGPVAVLLFLGPSGVGKTEVARTLAKYFHKSETAMIKIDCSQLKERHQTASLIGSPPGYIGYGDQAMLSQGNIVKSKKATVEQPLDDDDYDELVNSEAGDIFSEEVALRFEIKRIESEWRADQRFLDTLVTEANMLLKLLEYARNRKEEKEFREGLAMILDHIDNLKDDTIRILKQMQKCRERLEKLMLQIRQRKEVPAKEISTGAKKSKSDRGYPTIILFDEVEKAHEAVHDLMLQIMENGRLTMSNGQVSDLRNSIIILTSNVGSREITKKRKKRGYIGFETLASTEFDRDVFEIGRVELEKHFKTEFIGRLDSVVAFRHLKDADLFEILDKEIVLFGEALKKRNINFEASSAVKEAIVKASTDRPELGARLLRHKFHTMVKFPLGNNLYNLSNFSGDILAEYDKEKNKIKFKFSKTPIIEPEPQTPQ